MGQRTLGAKMANASFCLAELDGIKCWWGRPGRLMPTPSKERSVLAAIILRMAVHDGADHLLRIFG
jgi:hypothetical protein